MDDMTGDNYKKAVERLGMSLGGSAEFFGVTDKTVRNWISERHPIPNSVSMLLCLMIELELMPLDVVQVEEGCVIPSP
jgi:DNA-binding transcriptional regulator YiaG